MPQWTWPPFGWTVPSSPNKNPGAIKTTILRGNPEEILFTAGKHMKKKLLRTIVSSALISAVLIGSASAACIGGATTTTSLNLRSGAGTGYDIVTTASSGAAVIVEDDVGGGWWRVNMGGTRGYMSSKYLSFAGQMALSATGWVNGSSVRVRSGPGTDNQILGAFNTGTKVSITGVDGAWYKITANGLSGYMSSAYIVLSESEVNASRPIGEQLVDFAKQYLGYSYVWGGASPSTGFDCSGLVSYVFKQNGYETMRTAADIYYNNGRSVSKDELIPGDAVFFSTSSSYVGHVGMYIGDGQFIHASSGKGYVVISNLDDSYYTRMYVGAKRIAE